MTEESDAQAASGRDVFVSYASQDVAIADAVVETLERQGIKCWIAPRDVTPGSQYADEIVGAINDAKVVVLVLSEYAVASAHVGKEIERASSKRRRIIALRTDAAPLTRSFEYFLSDSQWIDVAALGMPGALAKVSPAVGQALAPSSWVSPGLGADARSPADRKRKPSYLTIQRVFAAAVFLVVAGIVVGVMVRYWPSKQGNAQAPTVAAISDKSIAVLPFQDMSEKKDQEYFSDGMAEEIIDLLVKIPELVVPARTSSFYFKGKSRQIPDIAKQLGVKNILEGSVRKSGNHLRVTAQLVRADTGYHLWSETYDRNLDDIFKTQDEIADAVVKALKISILKEEVHRVAPTSNNDAYTLFLQAQSLARRGNSADSLAAQEDLQRAVALDPQFALAWAALAELYTDDSVDWSRRFASEAHPEYRSGENTSDYGAIRVRVAEAAREAANRALTLAPQSPEVHRAMGRVHYWTDWNWQATDAELNAARALDPGDAGTTEAAAALANTIGRFDEGCSQHVRWHKIRSARRTGTLALRTIDLAHSMRPRPLISTWSSFTPREAATTIGTR